MKNWIYIPMLALIFTSCHKQTGEYPNPEERTLHIAGFKKISAGGSFTLSVAKGNDFSVIAKGRPADLDDLQLNVTSGDSLSIEYDRYKPNRYPVNFTIVLPELNAVNLSGDAEGTISGFADQPSLLKAVLSGNAELDLTGTAINLPVDLSGNAKLTASGQTLSLYGKISGNATLNSYGVISEEVDLSTSGNGHAYVFPQNSFFVDGSGESRVFYKGNPVQTNFIITGNAKVIRE